MKVGQLIIDELFQKIMASVHHFKTKKEKVKKREPQFGMQTRTSKKSEPLKALHGCCHGSWEQFDFLLGMHVVFF